MANISLAPLNLSLLAVPTIYCNPGPHFRWHCHADCILSQQKKAQRCHRLPRCKGNVSSIMSWGAKQNLSATKNELNNYHRSCAYLKHSLEEYSINILSVPPNPPMLQKAEKTRKTLLAWQATWSQGVHGYSCPSQLSTGLKNQEHVLRNLRRNAGGEYA